MAYRIRLTPEAAQDIERLFDFVLARELESPSGDLQRAENAVQAIRDGLQLLARSPFSCRKFSDNPFVRELIIPFGASGYVALFEIEDDANVVVTAVRHQREDDYH